MRRLAKSDAVHPPEWSPLLPTRAARRPEADVEVSVRIHRDGTQVAVVRQTVSDGGLLRTVGIDAVIR